MDKKPQNIMDTLTPVPTESDRRRIMPGNGVKFNIPKKSVGQYSKNTIINGINRTKNNLK